MTVREEEGKIVVEISCSGDNGCHIKAESLAAEIERWFGISSIISMGNNGALKVSVNGNTVYENQDPEDDIPNYGLIFKEIRKARKPTLKVKTFNAERDGEDNEEYREWMRAYCSGE